MTKPQPGKKIKRGFSCLFIGLFLIIFGYLVSILAGGFLIISDPVEKSSAVVMLSGGGDERLEKASELFKARIGTYFILTETGDPFTGSAKDISSATADRVSQLGIKKDYILVTREQSLSTLEEAKAVLSLADKRNMTSLIVVTDNFHSRRTKIIFNDVFKGSGIQIRIVAADTKWYSPWTWWMTQEGRTAFLQEYMKLIGYRIGLQSE